MYMDVDKQIRNVKGMAKGKTRYIVPYLLRSCANLRGNQLL
jgi:hypothetical protein